MQHLSLHTNYSKDQQGDPLNGMILIKISVWKLSRQVKSSLQLNLGRTGNYTLNYKKHSTLVKVRC
jgi:hypothetical protein